MLSKIKKIISRNKKTVPCNYPFNVQSVDFRIDSKENYQQKKTNKTMDVNEIENCMPDSESGGGCCL